MRSARVGITFTLSAVAGVVFGLAAPFGAQNRAYVKAGEIHIGGQGGFDYLYADAASHRLYVSNATQIVVIDTAKNAVIGTIADTPGVHGIAVVPGNRGFTSNGREGKANVVDLATLQTIKKVDIGPGPDGILYEPKHHEIWAMNHNAGTITVVTADAGAPVATITLSGKGVETAQSDPALDRVYVNLEEDSMVDVIDASAHKVLATWPVAPAKGPTGMAIDTVAHRLFIGGGPSQVMIDGRTGKVLASAAICAGTDATAYDPGTQYSFSSCRDGRISVFKVSRDALTPIQTIDTIAGARTMALDTATHKLYVVGQDYQPASAGTSAPPAGRFGRGGPPPVPDSFRALVFALQ